MADEMENEFMKRGYLLLKGCKDLSDAWMKPPALAVRLPQPDISIPLPPVIGEMVVPAQMTVAKLAEALREKPYRIIADLMQVGVFAMVSQQLAFEQISVVL